MEPDDRLTSDNPDAAVPSGADGGSLPERRCILTGVHGPRAALLRLAVGPGDDVAADLAARLPGRGAWIVADRGVLVAAMAKGKLRGALARAFKSNGLKIPDDLPERIDRGLERRALDRLGLENKAGNLIWGHERVGEALLRGQVRLLLHAADARPDGMGKLEARRRGASPETRSLVLPAGREQLSLALGRENVVHAAIRDAASAARVVEALDRWAAWAGLALTAAGGDDETHDQNGTKVETAIAVAAGERH